MSIRVSQIFMHFHFELFIGFRRCSDASAFTLKGPLISTRPGGFVSVEIPTGHFEKELQCKRFLSNDAVLLEDTLVPLFEELAEIIHPVLVRQVIDHKGELDDIVRFSD